MRRSYESELVIFAIIVFEYCFRYLYAVPYSCYADVCNVDTSAQFCDVVYRRCRRCEDVRTDCFSRMMTYNCTSYCYDMKHRHDMEQLRVSGCNTPSPPEHVRYHVNTTRVSFNTTLVASCDTGYSLLDGDQYICNNFSVWTGTRPICEETGSSVPTVVIMTVIAITILIANLIGLFFGYKRCQKNMYLQHTCKQNNICETNNSNCDQNLISTYQPHQTGDIATNLPQSTEQTTFIRNSQNTFGLEHELDRRLPLLHDDIDGNEREGEPDTSDSNIPVSLQISFTSEILNPLPTSDCLSRANYPSYPKAIKTKITTYSTQPE
ncbi:uncharacterized protein LOC127863239 isoform X2 [Dreissena polymorpha]|nr:uncharacterized protein LOC127863239 isoform X2 [Dreissena polymorpha]